MRNIFVLIVCASFFQEAFCNIFTRLGGITLLDVISDAFPVHKIRVTLLDFGDQMGIGISNLSRN
jgi:uncharacterized membrane protein